MNIINLTPHTIKFVNNDGSPILTVEPSGQIARVSTKTVRTGNINGIPITTTEYSEVTGVPEPKEGTIYIVSSPVAQRLPDRDDIFIRDEYLYDDKGHIIGCLSLGHI